MYVPAFTNVDHAAARSIVDHLSSGWLVTATADAPPLATLMPILWSEDCVVAHMAKANPHWRSITDGMPALFIITGPEAYVSPSWYPTKSEHGRVVPTWNYTAVQLTGTAYVRHDTEWKLRAVTALTDRHEGGREHRWQVTDAPEEYVAAQLGAIVGIELFVDSVAAKAKLSQNRSEADQRGVVKGLSGESRCGAAELAAMMLAHLDT